VSCIITWKNEPNEFPLVVYNALSFIAFSTEDPNQGIAGRLAKTGLIAPRLEWAVREEETNAARA
jgi:hypothetical protein